MDQERRHWQFGEFSLDARSRELLKNGTKQQLPERPFQILTALLEQPGEVVTRDELRHRLWSEKTFVDFDAGLNVSIARLRQTLEDDAENPRYIETLPRVGYRLIAAVEPPPVEAIPDPARRRPRLRYLLALASALAVVGLAALVPFARTPAHARAAVALRPSVAVMGFRNLNAKPDQAWLSTALSEMLSTELSAGERVRTIPGESVARTRMEMGLPEAESYGAPTLAKIRNSLGADYVIMGSYLDSGGPTGRVRVDLCLQDARTGETVTTLPVDGSEHDLDRLVAEAGVTLRQRLAAGFLSQAESSGTRAALPPSTDSARLYAEGLDRLRSFDARTARDLLGRAVAADPNYALAHAALSDAWAALGYGEVAKDEARKAFELSRKLSRTDRMSIEARYRESNGEWDAAIRIYQRLAEEFPDTAAYGMRMAEAQINAGRVNQALAILADLRKLPPPVSDAAAIGILNSAAAEKLGNFEQAQAAAAQAASIAEIRGAHILEAQARALQCRQLVQLSRLEDAVTACQQARAIYDRASDRFGSAVSMAYLASAYANQGRAEDARQLYAQAIQINREIGNSRGEAQWALNGLAGLLMDQGDLSGARRLYDESLRMARATGSRPDEASALANLGATWLTEGDLAQARNVFGQALKRFQALSAKAATASVMNNLGQTFYLAGDLPEADRMFYQALEADRETGAKLESADVLSWLGRVRIAQANWEEAAKHTEESVKLAGEIGGPVYTAQYRLAVAELAIATGHPADAEASLRACLRAFRGNQDTDREMQASVLLTHALLDEGKIAEAREEVARIGATAQTSQQRTWRLAFAIVAARAQASSGKPADIDAAARRLESTINEAKRQGFLGFQLQARLVLAEIRSRQGQRAAARGMFETVSKEAHAHGFESIARDAARAI